jgi:hypothetical protein
MTPEQRKALTLTEVRQEFLEWVRKRNEMTDLVPVLQYVEWLERLAGCPHLDELKAAAGRQGEHF